MVLIPEDVRCAVCKSIFCCHECRNRHELNAHNPNDVQAERNRLQCGLCQGYPTMEFQSRNDFALIMHLCQTHLPLHCKKCSTEFNSIGDFSTANKCSPLNDVCSLQSSKDCSNSKIEQKSTSLKDVSNINYVTAIQKSSFERSISDSVISLRNYSTILHTSNHPLYKTQSPDALEKNLVCQTSTPMQHNLMVVKSPESIEQTCSSCLVSSTSNQMACINSSSDSDTSINLLSKPHENRQNVQQQGVVVAQKKTTTFKRSRASLAMTPLTRQVMTKSIHRAILEYQHSHNGTSIGSPKSPLDLRVRRNSSFGEKSPLRNGSNAEKSIRTGDNNRLSSTVMKSNSLDSNSKLSQLETVYEQEKGAIVAEDDGFEHGHCIRSSYEMIEVTNENLPPPDEPIGETPVLVSRKLSAERIIATDDAPNDRDVWYTPKEFVQSKIFENIEIYTPKVSKKRPTARRVDDDEHSEDSMDDTQSRSCELSKTEPNKTSRSKIWSFVSTIMRLASFTPTSDLTMPAMKTTDNESHVIIKRCASFTGVLREKNAPYTSDEENEIDPLQPIKRRRITSIDTTIDQTGYGYRKRIMCRPPIRRMLNN